MHVISQKKLREFWTLHSDAEEPFRAWYRVVKSCDWGTPQQVKDTFNTSSQVGKHTVFRFKGSGYRIVAVVHFNTGKVFLRHVVTHAEYDRLEL